MITDQQVDGWRGEIWDPHIEVLKEILFLVIRSH